MKLFEGEVVIGPGQLDTDSLNAILAVPNFREHVQMGLIPGMRWLDKFAENPDVDTGTVPEDVVEQGGIYNWTANGGADYFMSSSNAADTMLIGLEIQTEDPLGNWNRHIIEQQLNGQTKTQVISPDGYPIVRSQRQANEGDTGEDLAGTFWLYEDSAVVGGVPSDPTKIISMIDNGNNQTLQGVVTVPTGEVGFLYRGEVGSSRSQTAGAVQNAYYSRRFGKVFRIKKRVDTTNSGNNIYQDVRTAPDIIPAKTDVKLTIEDVSANNTGAFGTLDMLFVDENLFTDEYLAEIGQIKRVTA